MLHVGDRLGHDAQHREQQRKIADHGRDEQTGEEAVPQQDENDRGQGDDGIGLDVVGRHLHERTEPGGLAAGDAHQQRQQDGGNLPHHRNGKGVQHVQKIPLRLVPEHPEHGGEIGYHVVGKAQPVLHPQQQADPQGVDDEELVDPPKQHSRSPA